MTIHVDVDRGFWLIPFIIYFFILKILSFHINNERPPFKVNKKINLTYVDCRMRTLLKSLHLLSVSNRFRRSDTDISMLEVKVTVKWKAGYMYLSVKNVFISIYKFEVATL